MSLLVCVDIDGTIADASVRFKEAGPEPFRHNAQDYTEWCKKVMNGIERDKPVKGMGALLATLGALGLVDVVYVTSREEKWRGVTEEWMRNNRFPIFPLYMRPEGSWEETDELKHRLVNKAKYTYKADEVILIDDDQKGDIEKMCHKNGYTFLKAMSGGKE